MDPAVAVLLAIVIALIPIFRSENKAIKKSIKDLENHFNDINKHQVVAETKLDIFLEHTGFDINKVNRTIKEHIEELKNNDKPHVGCINVKGLYRDREN